jgi:glycerol kinase
MEAMTRDAGLELACLRVDGGASRNDFLMQVQADLLGTPVERPEMAEVTALGAAALAGLAVGFWSDREELQGARGESIRFEPRMSAGEREGRLATWRRAVERSRNWAEEPG